ncbi:tetratricopeptide repeat protein [Patiriisocius sp. Uisw_047]|jgi:Ca-activated chloride channel family protein|uniref:tetratricopeptide repeat protein n=1 Tax=Patiriisocius sp. Uisw_047 TaxID=3230969 RepID=UPI0039ED38EB
MIAKTSVILRKYLGLMIVMLIPAAGFGQEETDALALKEQREAATLLSDASLQIEKKNFAIAEAQYREAIDLNQKSEVGKLNLGNAYYDENMNGTAMQRFKQAAQVATDKASKHKAFHNLGNTFMKDKMYTEAVAAYKNALRNNPSDDESRYNLALAKELLEKNPPPPTPDENGDDKDQDQENKEDQDKKDQENKDEQDEGDKKDDKKEGEDEKDKGKPDEPKDKKEGEDEQPQQPQPTPGKLSPQQVKSLLEAMNNEEKKVQDKINAKKEKGVKVKTDKDW